MTRIRGSLDIACPVGEVFDIVADQRNEPRYNPRMSASTKLTDGPIGVGTRFEATVLSRGKPLPVTTEYTDFQRPHLIASRSVMAGAVAAGHIRCDPDRQRDPVLLGLDRHRHRFCPARRAAGRPGRPTPGAGDLDRPAAPPRRRL